MARNTGPCHADPASYESRFWPNVPMKWQVICSCGYIKSGFTSEVSARLHAIEHEKLTAIPEPVSTLDEYLAAHHPDGAA